MNIYWSHITPNLAGWSFISVCGQVDVGPTDDVQARPSNSLHAHTQTRTHTHTHSHSHIHTLISEYGLRIMTLSPDYWAKRKIQTWISIYKVPWVHFTCTGPLSRSLIRCKSYYGMECWFGPLWKRNFWSVCGIVTSSASRGVWVATDL